MSKLEEIRKIFSDFAEQYDILYRDVSEYKEALDIFAYSLSSNATVLDLACGPANLSRYLKKQKPGLQFTLVDISNEMLDIANKHLPQAKIIQSPLQDCLQLNAKVEAIVCGFGIPYISDKELKTFIQTLAHILKPKGQLYLSWIANHYNNLGQQDLNDQYINYHSEPDLVKLLVDSGFTIDHCYTSIRIKSDESKDIEKQIIAQL